MRTRNLILIFVWLPLFRGLFPPYWSPNQESTPLIIPNLVFSVLICFIYYSLSFIEMNVKKRKESIYKKLNFVEDEVNSGSVRSPKLPIRFYLLYWADTQKWRWCSTHSKALKYHNYLYLKDKEWNIFIALMTRKAFLKLSDRTVRLIRK